MAHYYILMKFINGYFVFNTVKRLSKLTFTSVDRNVINLVVASFEKLFQLGKKFYKQFCTLECKNQTQRH